MTKKQAENFFRGLQGEEALPELLWRPERRMLLLQCCQDAAGPRPGSRQKNLFQGSAGKGGVA